MLNKLFSSSTELHISKARLKLSLFVYIFPFQKNGSSGAILHIILKADAGRSSIPMLSSLMSRIFEYTFSSYFSNALYNVSLNTSFIVASQSRTT